MRVVGLMSGTSGDGVDAALLQVTGDGDTGVEATLEAFLTTPYPHDVRERILHAVTDGGPGDLARLHLEVAQAFADATLRLLDTAGVAPADVAALGSHGHTVWHHPPGQEFGSGSSGGSAPGHFRSGGPTAADATEPGVDFRGISLQLGDPATLAARTGIPVVSDFRAADVAAGGHGAPLVPFADGHLLAHPTEARVLLNVGGMANLTWLPPRGRDTPPVAFDTGPGNALLDLAAAAATQGRLRCDEDGTLASRGRVDPHLLARLLDDPWFQRPPPRSTGRERFGAALLDRVVAEVGLTGGPGSRRASDSDTTGAVDGPPPPGVAPGWCDLLATLTALTAGSVARAVATWVLPRRVDRVVVTGGGAHNPALVAALTRALADHDVHVPVDTGTEALGMDPDAREAAAFALLAWAHLEGVSGNVPGCTGARGPRVLGSYTPAPQ